MASGISPTRHCFFHGYMNTIRQHNYNLNSLAEDVLNRVTWRDGQTIKLQRGYNDNSNLSFYNPYSSTPYLLYFNDEHPLLTTENLFSMAPDFRNSASDMDDEKVSEAFTAWLKEKTIAYIRKAIKEFVNSKITSREHKTILETSDVFPGAARKADKFEVNDDEPYQYLFGFEIVPARQSESLVINLEHLFLNFAKDENDIFGDGPSTWTQVFEAELFDSMGNHVLRIDGPNDTHFQHEPVSIPNNNGSYYVVFKYSRDASFGSGRREVYAKRRDWSKGPCETCSPSESRAWHTRSKFVEIHPFICSGASAKFNPNTIKYDYTTNFGIDAKISVMCDLSIFIKKNIDMFIPYIMKSVAIDFLREMAYNPNTRTNRNSINASKTEILYELDGDSSSMKKSGLIYKLEEYLKALKIDTSGVDRICLPCKNNGVKYRTV